MQEVPPAEPIEEGDEGVWDTVGEPAGSRSPAPTVEELLAQLEAVAAGVPEEAPAEGGLVDIASILGAPAVTIVRSNL
jgi:hypothetical protein